ncbi:MAG: GGDEF domain-containing protein [Spirochaetales bacterium]|nr:GGDEF domain-containing protein [Spirochaetales bacterium]
MEIQDLSHLLSEIINNINTLSKEDTKSKLSEFLTLYQLQYNEIQLGFKMQQETILNWEDEHQEALSLIMSHQAQQIELEYLHKELQTTYKRLEATSRIDYLTNLLNRRTLINSIGNEIKRIMRLEEKASFHTQENKKEPLVTEFLGHYACAFIDIDHFKNINDTHGHGIGDEVLKKLGEILIKNLRSTDICGRYGGEEFLIALADTNSRDAMIPLEKIAKIIKKTNFRDDLGELFNITISAGISEYYQSDSSYTDMINRADKALYYAKNNGRDMVICYENQFHKPEEKNTLIFNLTSSWSMLDYVKKKINKLIHSEDNSLLNESLKMVEGLCLQAIQHGRDLSMNRKMVCQVENHDNTIEITIQFRLIHLEDAKTFQEDLENNIMPRLTSDTVSQQFHNLFELAEKNHFDLNIDINESPLIKIQALRQKSA